MKLPSMVYASQKSEVEQVVFGGLNHSESAGAGEFYDMKNLCSDEYPILSTRPKRWKIYNGVGGAETNNVYALNPVGDTLYFMSYDALMSAYRVRKETDSQTKETVNMAVASVESVTRPWDVEKIYRLNNYLILFPMMSVQRTDISGEAGRGISAYRSEPGSVLDGTLYGKEASANCLSFATSWETAGFREGDGVHIDIRATKDAVPLLLETDAVIRELDGGKAYFDENIFEGLSDVGAWISVYRTVPEMDYVCVCGNRLMGCAGDHIYISKLGDPFNFNVFDGLSTDSWSVQTGSDGNFTGCIEYCGDPYFFKADAIYRLYGEYPSEYQLVKTDALGVKEGAGDSLAVVGDTLFYQSPVGVCAYSGGYPTVILPLSQMGLAANAYSMGASDGLKYYLCRWGKPPVKSSDDAAEVTMLEDANEMYVYDKARGLWHKEDGKVRPAGVSGFPGTTQLNLFGTGQGGVWLMGRPVFGVDDEGNEQTIGRVEDDFASFVEFGEGYHDSLNAKKLWRLHIRLWVAKGAKVKISISYDGGKYKVLREFGQTDKRSFVIPIAAKRCDSYRLRIDGVGEYKIYSLAREYAVSMGRER